MDYHAIIWVVIIEIMEYIEREPERDKIPAWLYYLTGLLDFHGVYTKLFAVHIKHSCFWPSADANPM